MSEFVIGALIGLSVFLGYVCVDKTRKIDEMTDTIRETRNKCDTLRKEKEIFKRNYDDLFDRWYKTIQQMNDTPDDCTLGAWCASCQFGKSFRYEVSNITVCGRDGVCKNYIEKGE